ncbi:Alpha/beta-hydrolase [Favolaschia claudopus]|uniref:Alpha/beta-hydrolase n=1 Tax=Favolaschia claudopus TaxID=2862362 RepID=A0AAW0CJT7_9AGAR
MQLRLSLFFFALTFAKRGLSTPLARADGATTKLTDDDIKKRDLIPIAAFAAAAYCVRAGQWNCGQACETIPDTQLVFTIGDNAATPDVYVAYSQARNQIIVGHEGTDPTVLLSVKNDVKFSPTPLLSVLNVAGTPEGVEVHNGFQTAWVQSSTLVLNAVKQVQAEVPDASILVTGHSLGAAIALLDAVFLRQQLPSNTSIEVVGFGRPRVGNPTFATWVDGMFGKNNTFVVSRDDPVPHVPLLIQGFQHTSGEIWIKNDTTTLACDGQENDNCSDTIGVLDAVTGVGDHTGPYFGVNMGHGSCANLNVTTVLTDSGGTPTKTVTTTKAGVTEPFSATLSLRVTNSPSNIPINDAVRRGGGGSGGVWGVGVALGAIGLGMVVVL